MILEVCTSLQRFYDVIVDWFGIVTRRIRAGNLLCTQGEVSVVSACFWPPALVGALHCSSSRILPKVSLPPSWNARYHRVLGAVRRLCVRCSQAAEESCAEHSQRLAPSMSVRNEDRSFDCRHQMEEAGMLSFLHVGRKSP